MRKRISGAVIGLAAALPLITPQPAFAHGYADSPPSRAALCAQRVVDGCGEIIYEPQSVEGPKGFPAAGPADGSICSAGHSRFAQLDDPRGGNWPAKALTAGQSFDFTWRLTAAHATASFRYFITRNGFDPARRLTRADLDPAPFLTVPYNGTRPGNVVSHRGTVPSGKTGRHMILGVWDIADTGNAFYSCSDVRF